MSLFQLPQWADNLRPHQVTAIQDVVAGFEEGNKVMLLDAPTGSGKTLIGEMVRQALDVRGLYLCSSLNLQHQFARDFTSAAILYGRSNYATADNATAYPELSAADCSKQRTTVPACTNCLSTEVVETIPHCQWCHPVTSCPYEQAKAHAIRSDLCCTNSTYFLYEANFVGNITLRRGLIVIDEADTLEDVLLNFVQVHLSEKRAAEYGIEPPSRKTVESAWIDWAVVAEQRVRAYLQSSSCRGSSLNSIRNRIRTQRLLSNIERLNDEETGIEAGGWVYTGYDKGDISFRPVRVDHLAGGFLWRHCERFLLMSASMISFQAVVEGLGIDEKEVEVV